LSGLAGSGLAGDDNDLMLFEKCCDLGDERGDRQRCWVGKLHENDG